MGSGGDGLNDGCPGLQVWLGWVLTVVRLELLGEVDLGQRVVRVE